VVTASTFGTGAVGPHQVVSQTVTGQSVSATRWYSFAGKTVAHRTGKTKTKPDGGVARAGV